MMLKLQVRPIIFAFGIQDQSIQPHSSPILFIRIHRYHLQVLKKIAIWCVHGIIFQLQLYLGFTVSYSTIDSRCRTSWSNASIIRLRIPTDHIEKIQVDEQARFRWLVLISLHHNVEWLLVPSQNKSTSQTMENASVNITRLGLTIKSANSIMVLHLAPTDHIVNLTHDFSASFVIRGQQSKFEKCRVLSKPEAVTIHFHNSQLCAKNDLWSLFNSPRLTVHHRIKQ